MGKTATGRLAGAAITVAAVAAGAVLIAAPATEAAPRHKLTSTEPALVDATGTPVDGVVDIPGGTSVIRLVDGVLFRFDMWGRAGAAVGNAEVAYKDAACSPNQGVLVNSDVWDDPTTPLYEPPITMGASVRDWAGDRSIIAAYAPTGEEAQSGQLYGKRQSGECVAFVDFGGSPATTNYYPAEQIPLPADLPGPLSFG